MIDTDEYKGGFSEGTHEGKISEDIKADEGNHDDKPGPDMEHLNPDSIRRKMGPSDDWLERLIQNLQTQSCIDGHEIGSPGIIDLPGGVDHLFKDAIRRMSEGLKRMGHYIAEQLGMCDTSRPPPKARF